VCFTPTGWGFRDEDYETKTKPTGMYRLAFIGDSVTVGLGVSWDHTFVKRISGDAATKRQDPTLQVMNFGVGGYNVIQIRACWPLEESNTRWSFNRSSRRLQMCSQATRTGHYTGISVNSLMPME
jgi:hypothetical protein